MTTERRPPPVPLVGDDLPVPCVDGADRPYLSLDAAASTAALPAVAQPGHRVPALVLQRAPWRRVQVPGVHRRLRGRPGRRPRLRRPRRRRRRRHHRAATPPRPSTTSPTGSGSARLTWWSPPWSSTTPTCCPGPARRPGSATSSCDAHGTFGVDDVVAALDAGATPRLLALTGASNVTGWSPPLDAIIDAAHDRNVPVLVDAAQLAPHRPLPAGADFVAWSGHKMYAPFGAGVLIGPRATPSPTGDPFLAGGGAVDLVDLDEVLWTDPARTRGGRLAQRDRRRRPPRRHRRAARRRLGRHRRPRARPRRPAAPGPRRHRRRAPARSRPRHAHPRHWPRSPSPGCPTPSSPPASAPSSASASATAASAPTPTSSASSASRPTPSPVTATTVRRGDRTGIPGAVRASCSIATTAADVDRFLAAVAGPRRRYATAHRLHPGHRHRRLPPERQRAAVVQRATRRARRAHAADGVRGEVSARGRRCHRP